MADILVIDWRSLAAAGWLRRAEWVTLLGLFSLLIFQAGRYALAFVFAVGMRLLDPGSIGTRSVTLDDDGVGIQSPTGTQFYAWDAVRAAQGTRGFLHFRTALRWHFVPAESFESRSSFLDAVDFARGRCGARDTAPPADGSPVTGAAAYAPPAPAGVVRPHVPARDRDVLARSTVEWSWRGSLEEGVLVALHDRIGWIVAAALCAPPMLFLTAPWMRVLPTALFLVALLIGNVMEALLGGRRDAPRVLDLGEAGLRTWDSRSQGSYEWRVVTRAVETEKAFLFRVRWMRWLCAPKASFAGIHEIPIVEDLLRRQLGRRARLRPQGKGVVRGVSRATRGLSER